MNPQRIAVIGLGQMGARYARRFVDAGFAVTVWNRSPHKAEALAARGASVAASPGEAIEAADIVVAALENAAAFRETFLTPPTLGRFSARHLLIDTGTVHPGASREAHAVLAGRGCRYLDAPVSGGTVGAAQGTLTILVGGDAADFLRAQPVFEILGKAHLLGPTGAGQVAKLVNQTIVAVTIGAVAEGLFLGERAGIRPAALLSALQGGFADSRILREHGRRMAERNFAPGAANRIFLKDLTAIGRLAGELDTTLPLTHLTAEAFANLVACGHGEADHSGYFIHLGLINDPDNSAPRVR
jgi:2-hydroxy-3-oxopropionate reductase